jgi:hypothetical protein
MIVIELMVAIMVAVVVITGIMKVAAPIADAFSEKLRLKFQEIGPEQERQFRLRMEALEQQVRELQTQVANLQEVANFNAGMSKPDTGDRIKLGDLIQAQKSQIKTS